MEIKKKTREDLGVSGFILMLSVPLALIFSIIFSISILLFEFLVISFVFFLGLFMVVKFKEKLK